MKHGGRSSRSQRWGTAPLRPGGDVNFIALAASRGPRGRTRPGGTLPRPIFAARTAPACRGQGLAARARRLVIKSYRQQIVIGTTKNVPHRPLLCAQMTAGSTRPAALLQLLALLLASPAHGTDAPLPVPRPGAYGAFALGGDSGFTKFASLAQSAPVYSPPLNRNAGLRGGAGKANKLRLSPPPPAARLNPPPAKHPPPRRSPPAPPPRKGPPPPAPLVGNGTCYHAAAWFPSQICMKASNPVWCRDTGGGPLQRRLLPRQWLLCPPACCAGAGEAHKHRSGRARSMLARRGGSRAGALALQRLDAPPQP
jgi:hypothetical protein